MAIFRRRLAARLANRGDSRLGLLQMALLNAEFLLLLDQQLDDLEITELRAQFLLHKRLADVDARLDHWNDRLEFVDRRRRCSLLGFLLRLLTGECGNLGAVLGHLVKQKLTLGGDQIRVGIGGRHEVGHGIIAVGECRAQARDVEPLGEEVVAHVIALRRIHGWIELDQHVAGLDRLPVLHPNGAHDPGLKRLNDLGATTRHDFSGRRRNDVDRAPPGPDQRRAEHHDDGGADATADRRWRCFHNFKRRRQKCQLFATFLVRTAKRNDALLGHGGQRCFNRLHGVPACNRCSDA